MKLSPLQDHTQPTQPMQQDQTPPAPAVTVEKMTGAQYRAQWTSAYEKRRERDAQAYISRFGRDWALEECNRAAIRAWRRFDAGAEEARDDAMYLEEVAEHLTELLARTEGGNVQ